MQAGRCCKCTPPVPFLGSIYRTFSPAVVADYAGYSTASWTTGALTGWTGVALSTELYFEDMYGLYYLFTIANPRTTGHEVILDPVRWTCDMPASNGGRWDYWTNGTVSNGVTGNNYYGWVPNLTGGQYTNRLCVAPALTMPAGFGSLAMRPELLPPSSHCEFYDDELTVVHHNLMPSKRIINRTSPSQFSCSFEPMGNFERAEASAVFVYDTLNTAAATAGANYISVAPMTVSIAYVQQRINGVAVGTPQTSFTPISPVVADDEYEVDIWYRVKVTPSTIFMPYKTAFAIVIPQYATGGGASYGNANTSTRVLVHAGNRTPYIAFGNVNMNTAFTSGTHTYNLTLNGHSGWTLKGGTDGPHKMQTSDNWTAVFTDASITWTPPQSESSRQYVTEYKLSWDSEIARLTLKCGPAMFAAGVESNALHLYYAPTAGTSYRTSSQSINETGTINHAPNGLFTQGGTTTFSLVEWSVLNQNPLQYNFQSRSAYRALDGRKTGPLPFIPEVPTSITVARTTR